MVDALHQAHRAVRPNGIVIDLRPDSAHPPLVLRGGRVIGGLYEQRMAIADNHFSDRALASVVRDGLLRPVRAGHFWYDLPAMNVAALRDYVAESRRIGGFTRGTRSAIARHPERTVVMRRALAYGIYRRV
jgi:hypothetical protein